MNTRTSAKELVRAHSQTLLGMGGMSSQSKMWFLPFIVSKALDQLVMPDLHLIFMDK